MTDDALKAAVSNVDEALRELRLARNEYPTRGATSELDKLATELSIAGYKVTPPPPPPPVNVCATTGCDRTDADNERAGFGPLVDIEIRVAYGEEGAADPRRFFCFEHVGGVTDELIKLGFGVHRHGGINFLEPEDCPGYKDMDACPTPVEDGEQD